jgi:hypothetical protein
MKERTVGRLHRPDISDCEVPPDIQGAARDFILAARAYVEVCSRHGIAAKKSSGGRKTLCKPQLTNQICELLADSVSIRTTCQVVGISEATFHAWCVRGAFGEAPFAEFLERTTCARAQARVSIVRGIRRAGAKDHRALAWLAEHCHADEFCPPKEQGNMEIKRGPERLFPPLAGGQFQIRVESPREDNKDDGLATTSGDIPA